MESVLFSSPSKPPAYRSDVGLLQDAGTGAHLIRILHEFRQVLLECLFLFTLPMFRRFSRGGKYAQNLDAFQAWSDTIRYEVPGTRDDEFTRAEDAAGKSQRWILRQQTHRFMDLLNDFPGHCRVIPGDILGFLIKVGQGFPQPLNLHSRPICPAFFPVLSRWQNSRHPLRPGPF